MLFGRAEDRQDRSYGIYFPIHVNGYEVNARLTPTPGNYDCYANTILTIDCIASGKPLWISAADDAHASETS